MQTTERWARPALVPVPPAKSLDRILEEMGARVRKARLAKGWSQTDLGRRVGMVQHNVSALENGQRAPTFEHLLELARVLGMTLDELVFGRKC